MEHPSTPNPRLLIRVHGVDGLGRDIHPERTCSGEAHSRGLPKRPFVKQEKNHDCRQTLVTASVASKLPDRLSTNGFSDWKLPPSKNRGANDPSFCTKPLCSTWTSERRRQHLPWANGSCALNIEMLAAASVPLRSVSWGARGAFPESSLHRDTELVVKVGKRRSRDRNLANAVRFTVYPGSTPKSRPMHGARSEKWPGQWELYALHPLENVLELSRHDTTRKTDVCPAAFAGQRLRCCCRTFAHRHTRPDNGANRMRTPHRKKLSFVPTPPAG